MRRVERSGPVPEALIGASGSPAETERHAAARHVAEARARVANKEKRGKAFEFEVYKDMGARRTLERLFAGKCAYCESDYAAQAPVDIEHFRPKGAVEGDPDHYGYWWLASEWTNLLPSCIDCNRRRYQVLPAPGTASLAAMREQAEPIWSAGKQNAFPVVPGTRAYGTTADPDAEIAAEQPYLLDPCRDDPALHIEYLVDAEQPFALALPRRLAPGEGGLPLIAAGANIAPGDVPAHVSVRGAVSIHVYGLNRLGLVQARTRVLRHLELLGALVIEAQSVAAELEKSRSKPVRHSAGLVAAFADRLTVAIRDMGEPGQPYSALVNQWIDQWSRKLLD